MKDLCSEKLRLIPFDGKSDAHAKRLYHQRIGCGWAEDEIEAWRVKHEKGEKGLFWLVLQDGVPGRDKLMEDHSIKYPEEKELLKDSSISVLGLERTATNQDFDTIGHIAVERRPATDKELGFPADEVAWITSLYISFAMQHLGLGRDVMNIVEKFLTREPLNARTAALDTMDKKMQLSPLMTRLIYEVRGHKIPAVLRSNEEW
ncbi:hypothetical protein SAPIO_CDS7203 [Scedosporium apiospermum]|uniref:N-acetyltransferase domain-containing protein n=1 Tax=Pseudallescheria apiosperma TaxID=563466 RepID=A0A084G1C0_PSEDA|nr:uncharacterized protein SAPIO_CDS7203 [Scedosporium apiospermum]KEZ41132.1 hypothetical protein SAPIO_CDS7203 [Scedosporium apiospermum]